jgi:hypothetical protein
MGRKVELIIIGVIATICIFVACFVSASFLHNLNNKKEETVSYTLSESESYNSDTLPESEEDFGVTYEAGLNTYINTEEFAIALSKVFTESVIVKEYNGGRYGVFYVKISVGGDVYDGVWDDGNREWYNSVSEYNSSI